MSVFLRWGVFGILGVAALLYAYNASKRWPRRAPRTRPRRCRTPADDAAAEEPTQPASRQQRAESVVSVATASRERAATPATARRSWWSPNAPSTCARKVRRSIACCASRKSPGRNRRSGASDSRQVATRWFGYTGDFGPEALRIAVINDCRAGYTGAMKRCLPSARLGVVDSVERARCAAARDRRRRRP